MPFGLNGAPATFQRLMDTAITLNIRPPVIEYSEDVIDVLKTFKKHLHWLQNSTNRLDEVGLTLSPDKCKFFQSDMKYLGFKVNIDGL